MCTSYAATANQAAISSPVGKFKCFSRCAAQQSRVTWFKVTRGKPRLNQALPAGIHGQPWWSAGESSQITSVRDR